MSNDTNVLIGGACVLLVLILVAVVAQSGGKRRRYYTYPVWAGRPPALRYPGWHRNPRPSNRLHWW